MITAYRTVVNQPPTQTHSPALLGFSYQLLVAVLQLTISAGTGMAGMVAAVPI